MSSVVSEPSKVSFTVRRPTPVSRQGSSGLDSDQENTFKVPALPRHLTESGRSTPARSPLANGGSLRGRAYEPDSSDGEAEDVDEIVTGFDQFGVQRANEKKKEDEGPLIIPALANKDWREVARKRKAVEMYVPSGGAAKTGADGSVGGLGTRDSINSGPALVGLVVREKKVKMDVDETGGTTVETISTVESIEETPSEDELARRALIARANGEQEIDPDFTIPAIPASADYTKPVDETDAYRRDVVTRPESASLEDYERVPVEQFGAALLRGMGWKPGQAASRTRTGLVEPYLPAARPALLGIGAKEREALDDGSKSKKPTRPERRYVPIVKRERTRDGESGKDSRPASRRSSRSPDSDRKRDGSRRNDRDSARDKDGERDHKDRDRDHDKRREYSDDRDRRRDRDRDHVEDRDRKERRKDRDYDDYRDRDRRDRDRYRDKNRRDRDRVREGDSEKRR